MKKSLIALAVLAASGAAMAQSSVTLSGNVNLGVVKNDGVSAKLGSAGSNNVVFKGTEDLGGGLKANFTLGQRLSLESGREAGSKAQQPIWAGESTVGLSGNFGAVKLGRSLTALQGPVNATDPWGTWTVGSTAALANGYVTDTKANVNGEGSGRTDAITYASPSFGGFSGAVSLGLKNSQAGAASGGTTNLTTPGTVPTQPKNLGSIWLSYANGPIMIGGGYEQNRQDHEIAAILGTYDFGIAKLMAGYGQVDTGLAGDKGKNWNLGVAAPIGAFTLKAGYYSSKAEGTVAGAEGPETKKLGIGGEYALSKRTYLYTTYGRKKVEGAAATKDFDLGIAHAF